MIVLTVIALVLVPVDGSSLTATTPWEQHPTSPGWGPTIEKFSNFMRDYKLGDPDVSGVRTVLKPGYDNVLYPICDDYWTDLEAQKKCQLNGFKYGRRAQAKAEREYIETQLYCFEFFTHSAVLMGAIVECTTVPYTSDGATLPCHDEQAAAVRCWQEPYVPVVARVALVTTTKKKFKVKLMLGSEKYGRFHNCLADDALNSGPPVPSKNDFSIDCNGESMKFKMKANKNTGEITISGKFKKKGSCKLNDGDASQLYYHDYLVYDMLQAKKFKGFVDTSQDQGSMRYKLMNGYGYDNADYNRN